MFCPICKSEYREGFTTCSDCHVALVEQPPESDSPRAFHVLWSGESAVFQDQLLEELERAKIGAVGIPRYLLFRNSGDVLHVERDAQFGLAVCIQNSDVPAAQPILEKLLEQEPEETGLNSEPIPLNMAESAVIPELPQNWDGVGAVEAWTGTDAQRAEFSLAALNGVGIPTLRESDNAGNCRIMVRQEDKARAKEVLQQIETNTPPERDLVPRDEYAWLDEPVASHRLLWLMGLPFFSLALVVLIFGPPYGPLSFLGPLLGLAAFVGDIGAFWMVYQAVRYEIRPLRFVIIGLLVPFSFIWYYYERSSKRTGVRRLPVAIRTRMPPPTSA